MVGVFEDAVLGVKELTPNHGDRFFLYSDGLIETGGTREEGIRRIAGACAARKGASLEIAVPSILGDITDNSVARHDTILMGVEI